MAKFIEKIKSAPKKDKIKFAVLLGFILVTLIVAAILFPYILSLGNKDVRDSVKDQILSFGIWGWLIFVALQAFQIVFAIIPREPIEVIAGLLYGTWGGLAACLLGSLLGSVLIYYLVKLLGYSFISRMIDVKKTERFKFLHNNKRLNVIIFILFFIPGTPKDALSYVIPLTAVKPMQYFIITTIARIPSVITSTYAGSAIDNEEWIKMAVIFIITGAVAIVGIIFNDKIINFFSRVKQAEHEKLESVAATVKKKAEHSKKAHSDQTLNKENTPEHKQTL